MRRIIIFALMVSVTGLNAQTYLPGSFLNNTFQGSMINPYRSNDSISQKKWSVSKYAGLSTSFLFFKAGSATIVSAPIGLQLNRRISDNISAFAGVSLAPAYVNFSRSFMSGNVKGSQQNTFLQLGNLGMYSRAELGLQYTNDEKTFSISGSIGVGSSSYPIIPYYQMNTVRPNPVITSNR